MGYDEFSVLNLNNKGVSPEFGLKMMCDKMYVVVGKMLTFFVMVVVVCFHCAKTQDQHCQDRVTSINVTSSGGVFYSPGYPEEYHSGEVCKWLLTSRVVGKVLQLLPLDMHVGRTSKRKSTPCSGDVVSVYDGPAVSPSRLLHEWCGKDTAVVHSSSSQLLVAFRPSHRLQRHRGFAIKYSLVTLGIAANSTCSEKIVQTIPLDDTPVILDLTHVRSSPNNSVCSWRVVADDIKSHVVIDLESYPGLECQDGNFSVYDGASTSSPEILRWCARASQPFTSVHASGGQAMVVVRMKGNFTPFLRFRFRTRSAVSVHCNDTHMPDLELQGTLPVFVMFPFATNTRGANCPLRLVSSEFLMLKVRVDLLEVEGQPATCNMTSFVVDQVGLAGNITRADKLCWRDNHPVFWPNAESVVLSLANGGRRGLVRLVPSGAGHCHGMVERHAAPTDQALIIREPVDTNSLQYANDLWCRYVISGQNEADHVLVRITGELCEKEDVCRDYVKVYDGPTTKSPLLYDSTGEHYVNVFVTSRGQHVTYEVSTDDRDNQGFIRAEFNSVPDGSHCEEVQHYEATKVAQNLSSINYPHYYPVNYMCQFCITSEEKDDVIHLHVLDTDLTYSCSDSVEVYDGLENDPEPDFLGQFCGQDTPSYVSKKGGVCLLFRTDPTLHGRGWLLSYRAAPLASTGGASASIFSAEDGSMVGTAVLGGLLAAVTIALIVMIILFIVRRKKQ